MNKSFLAGSGVLAISLFNFCCTYEKADIIPSNTCSSVTFTKDIKQIINKRCAISGCHVLGFLPGDFTRLENLKKVIDNGKFQFRVFETKTMPPLSKLGEDTLTKIKCWLDNGAD